MHTFCMHFCMHFLHANCVRNACKFTCIQACKYASAVHENSHAFCVKFAHDLHRICNLCRSISVNDSMRLSSSAHLVNNDAFGNTFSLQNTRLCTYFLIYVVETVFTYFFEQLKSASNKTEYYVSCDQWCIFVQVSTYFFSQQYQTGWNAMSHHKRQSARC